MTEYNRPGVFVSEQDSPVRSIAGANSSTVAIIGCAQMGPVAGVDNEKPQLVTSWEHFKQVFGDEFAGYLMPSAVYEFFALGGSRLFVSRIAGANAVKASLNLQDTAGTQANVLKVEAKYPGAYGNGIKVTVAADKSITIKMGDVTEVKYPATTSVADALAALNTSALVKATLLVAGNGVLAAKAETALTAGANGDLPDTVQEFEGTVDNHVGLNGLASIDEVLTIIAPDAATMLTSADLTLFNNAAASFAKTRMSDMFVADAPADLTPTAVAAFYDAHEANGYLFKTFPWIEMVGPVKNVKLPASVAVAAKMSKMDAEKGPWVAAAGVDTPLEKVVRLVYDVTDAEQDVLNVKNVNCLRTFAGYGTVLWGYRTSAAQLDWRYANVRKLFNKMEKELKDGLKWVVFKGNDEATWGRVTNMVNEYLLRMWKAGALKGATPEEAFFVKCDGEINTQANIDLGLLKARVGAAPAKVGEFIVIEIGQYKSGSTTVSES